MPLAPGITAALTDIVGPCHVVPSNNERGAGIDSHLGDVPDAIVYPGTTTEVAQVMRGAQACDLAVLTTEDVVLRDGDAGQIVLNLSRLDKVLELNPGELIARVQPEVRIEHLMSEIVSAGFDVARVPREGPLTASDHVLEVEAVLLSGRVVRAVRQPFGDRYDAVDLVAGTSGLLCVITEVTIALLPALVSAGDRWNS